MNRGWTLDPFHNFYPIISRALAAIIEYNGWLTYLSVTVTAVVVRKTLVDIGGVTVGELCSTVVLLLIIGSAVVRVKPTVSSLVLVDIPSVPSWV